MRSGRNFPMKSRASSAEPAGMARQPRRVTSAMMNRRVAGSSSTMRTVARRVFSACTRRISAISSLFDMDLPSTAEAPAAAAGRRISGASASAVRRITGISASAGMDLPFIHLQRSTPVSSGRFRSVNTRSNLPRGSASFAAAMVDAVSTSKPAASRIVSRRSACAGESSTIRIFIDSFLSSENPSRPHWILSPAFQLTGNRV